MTENEAVSCVQTESEVQGPGNSRGSETMGGSETMAMGSTIYPSPTGNGLEIIVSASCIRLFSEKFSEMNIKSYNSYLFDVVT